MEIQLPNYTIKKYIADKTFDIHGDFNDKIIIEFENVPSQQFIDSVKKRVVADETKEYKRWLKHDEHQYRFQAFYGDGGRTPKCRERDDDWIISLNFSDNSKEAVIEYGHW